MNICRNSELIQSLDVLKSKGSFPEIMLISKQTQMRFLQTLQVEDIPDDWKNGQSKLTVDFVQKNQDHYIDYFLHGNFERGLLDLESGKGVASCKVYLILQGMVWVGLLVDRVFDIPEFEPIVGNLGIEIFQKFRAEGFGKQTIITWIEQERNKNPERPLWSVCMDTNLASYKLHASLGVHQSEYDRQHPIHPHCNILSYKF